MAKSRSGSSPRGDDAKKKRRPATEKTAKPARKATARKATPAAAPAPEPAPRRARRGAARPAAEGGPAATPPRAPATPPPTPAVPAPPPAPIEVPGSRRAEVAPRAPEAGFGAGIAPPGPGRAAAKAPTATPAPTPAPAPPAPTQPRAAAPPRAPALPFPDEEGWVPVEESEEGWEPVPAKGERPSETRPPRHEIPPLPEEEDFEPIEEVEEEASREAPEGAAPGEMIDAVRHGDLHVAALDRLTDEEVLEVAREEGLDVPAGERRPATLLRLLHHVPEIRIPDVTYEADGLLEVMPEGYGFLRHPRSGYVPTAFDPYVGPPLIRRYRLQSGHWVSGTARSPRPGDRYAALLEVSEVNHEDPSVLERLVPFDRLVVTHPDHRFVLETTPDEVAMRVLDLFCPLGRGQRALIVSPPRAGKTILLQKIADSLARNSPEVEIVVLLLDERPEEVTNMRRSVRGEVIASTFDQPPHRHIRLAELAMDKVRRMVEFGRHVVLLLDSLTRLGRAYNNESHGTGRLLTGGLEASALTKPKRFFGAARNIEHGGSLTIVATSLVDTGSRLDQVIFEEFKGTGNMEIDLSREVANQRIWPAIDVAKSGTRKEELLLHPEEHRRITALRREMLSQEPAEALLEVLEKMAKYRTNAELLMRVSTS